MLSQDGQNPVTFKDIESLILLIQKQKLETQKEAPKELPKILLNRQSFLIISQNLEELIQIKSLEEFKLRFIQIVNENNILLKDINDKVMTNIFKRIKRASEEERRNFLTFLDSNFQEEEEQRINAIRKSNMKADSEFFQVLEYIEQ